MLSSMPQEPSDETPIKGGSPVMSESSSHSELPGGPPTGGTDCPIRPPVTVDVPEGTMTPALMLEHQAEVHSAPPHKGQMLRHSQWFAVSHSSRRSHWTPSL